MGWPGFTPRQRDFVVPLSRFQALEEPWAAFVCVFLSATNWQQRESATILPANVRCPPRSGRSRRDRVRSISLAKGGIGITCSVRSDYGLKTDSARLPSAGTPRQPLACGAAARLSSTGGMCPDRRGLVEASLSVHTFPGDLAPVIWPQRFGACVRSAAHPASPTAAGMITFNQIRAISWKRGAA
jgi:hypothetical protein